MLRCFTLDTHRLRQGISPVPPHICHFTCAVTCVFHMCHSTFAGAQVGEMTQAPIRTEFGYHLILCEGRK